MPGDVVRLNRASIIAIASEGASERQLFSVASSANRSPSQTDSNHHDEPHSLWFRASLNLHGVVQPSFAAASAIA